MAGPKRSRKGLTPTHEEGVRESVRRPECVNPREVNREPQTIVKVSLDLTGSIASSIPRYQAGLGQLLEDTKNHPAARSSAYLSIDECGSSVVTNPFVPLVEAKLPKFDWDVGSPGAKWLSTGVADIRRKLRSMSDEGSPLNKAIWIFCSDYCWDDPHNLDAAIEEYRALEKEVRGLNTFIVLIGEHADRAVASRISRRRPPVALDELKVDELFRWVSGVIISASMSQPGESISLPEPKWSKLDG